MESNRQKSWASSRDPSEALIASAYWHRPLTQTPPSSQLELSRHWQKPVARHSGFGYWVLLLDPQAETRTVVVSRSAQSVGPPLTFSLIIIFPIETLSDGTDRLQ